MRIGRAETADGRRQTAADASGNVNVDNYQTVAEPQSSDCDPSAITASVNICFESSVSHLIRRHILTLRKEGHDPRLLINISNDGWFRFSQQIDQHLATHVFRAVENRMHYVAATNGGFSAIITPEGVIQEIGKRGAAEAVIGTIGTESRKPQTVTLYQRYGDGYALVCAVFVLGLITFGRLRKSGGLTP